ncbi:hypothetical protein K431DRAFT_4128 [Polychaeton citri CBS 116435]|uniref:Uncharacterized protein n=1 Tax=Polychaeton citri CBS 116435 TaxID=1314669 RepID=A0A9P4UVI3_9PEZI|nr:hypothetical protein K431DRAFT_4128 [Polychaeton citri CBS 116435]
MPLHEVPGGGLDLPPSKPGRPTALGSRTDRVREIGTPRGLRYFLLKVENAWSVVQRTFAEKGVVCLQARDWMGAGDRFAVGKTGQDKAGQRREWCVGVSMIMSNKWSPVQRDPANHTGRQPDVPVCLTFAPNVIRRRNLMWLYGCPNAWLLQHLPGCCWHQNQPYHTSTPLSAMWRTGCWIPGC